MDFDTTSERIQRAQRAERDSEGHAGRSPAPRSSHNTLEVGRVDDPLERHADATADLVMRVLASPGPPVVDTSAPATATGGRIARVQRRSDAPIGAEGGAVDAETDRAIRRASGGGHPLPDATRSQMEHAFGTDLGGVRVHEGPHATDLSNRIQAKAFTVGSDVFFRDGMPDTTTKSGQHLVAHELTHTIQQGAGAATSGGGNASRVRRASTHVQRMPSLATVKARSTKKSKSGTKILGKKRGATNTYNELLDSIQSYDTYKATKIARTQSDITAQLDSINRRIDVIAAASAAYLAKGTTDPSVATIATELIDMAHYEKRAAADIAASYATKATSDPFGLAGATWRMELPRDARTYKPKAVDRRADQMTASGGGGQHGQNKSVEMVTDTSGTKGVFAQSSTGGKYDEIDPLKAGVTQDVWEGPRYVLGGYGVTGQDLNLDSRSIAMSRLDSMLGGGMIARTKAAYLGDKTGTFQELAKGDQGTLLQSRDQVPKDDPNLARLLSRLQLIDTIAGQLDRHAGNYFVQRNRSGKVTGITGIDLDMSWIPTGGANDRGKFDLDAGTSERGGKYAGEKLDWYPGASKFVDKELAETIIALRPDDLRAILIDLITPEEIAAAVERLVHLQRILGGLQQTGQLLAPNEWTSQVRANLLTEKHSYYAQIVTGSR